MGRSVSYPSNAIVTFADYNSTCDECDGKGTIKCGQCKGTGETQSASNMEDEPCPVCDTSGTIECEACDGTGRIDTDWDEETIDLQRRIAEAFPSFQPCDEWLGREDHAIAENRFAYFGMSEYCGLVAFWLKAKELDWDSRANEAMQDRWLDQVKDRFISTFGELTKVGVMSNGEGVYRQIDSRK